MSSYVQLSQVRAPRNQKKNRVCFLFFFVVPIRKMNDAPFSLTSQNAAPRHHILHMQVIPDRSSMCVAVSMHNVCSTRRTWKTVVRIQGGLIIKHIQMISFFQLCFAKKFYATIKRLIAIDSFLVT